MNNPEELFEKFIESYHDRGNVSLEGSQIAINRIRKYFKSDDVSNVTWETARRHIEDNINRKQPMKLIEWWLRFLIYLDETGNMAGEYAGMFLKYRKDIEEFITHERAHKVQDFMNPKTLPSSFFLAPYKIPPENKRNLSFIIPGCDDETNQIFKKYLASMDDKLIDSRLRRGFITVMQVLCEKGVRLSQSIPLNDKTFIEHFNIIDNNASHEKMHGKQTVANVALGDLISFYLWYQSELDDETRNNRFKLFPARVLKYTRLVPYLQDGYNVVNYSVYEEPPKHDKIILCPQGTNVNQTRESDKITSLDVSGINNKVLRKWVKECFWYDTDHNIHTRSKNYQCVFDFIGIVDNHCSAVEEPTFQVDDVLRYKANIIADGTQDSTVARKLGMVKHFLNYVEENGYQKVEPLLFRLLVHHDSPSNAYKETYTKEEIHSLLESYKAEYESTSDEDLQLLYALYYYIIAIQAVSELRVSTILNLRIDCIRETLSRGKYKEYKVVVPSKTSGKDDDEYNITRYVKGLIDEVKGITASIREEATRPEKDYLFIYKRHNHGIVSIVRQDAVSTHHNKICDSYGIKKLRLGAIRNYYQQQVSDYVSKSGDDPLMIERLSHHGINVHIQHYDAVDIRSFCEHFYEVEIGNIELKGRIEEKASEEKSRTVVNGCGQCSLERCVLSGTLDCLMCDKFVTTLDCIPFFEKEIETIDKVMLKQTIPHEKEFLTAKKRLNVAYLTKLYELEEQINGRK